ncbi:MAG: LysM peptidoglycan-binding domain-containing protein [Firmicutes bacterium]|nr:LysM peptidoglycan-binding domain-containing protein [Bacillota bacterium]
MDNFDMNRPNSELPKELTEILMKNHPFKGETEERPSRKRVSEERAERRMAERQAREERAEKTSSSSNPMLEAIRNRALRENSASKENSLYSEMPDEETKMIDVEQIKKAREEMIAEEETQETYRPDYIEEVKAEKKTEIPTIEDEVKPERKKSPHFNNITFDDYEDDQVQVVRHKSRNKINTVPRPAEKGEKLASDSMFFNYAVQEGFEDIVEKAEFTERPKQPKAEVKKSVEYTEVKNYKTEDRGEALDGFFRDNAFDRYDEDDEKSGFIKYAAIAGVLLIALFIFFAVRSFSLSAKLSDANEQIAVYEELQKENEELKMSTLALTEEIEKMKLEQAEAEKAAAEEEVVEEEPAQTSTGSTTTTTSTPSASTNTYTVVAGDTFGAISTKVYGNFSGYKKIMEANGITNEGSLQIGQKLIIP